MTDWDAAIVPHAHGLGGEELAALLSELSEAPDLPAAAALLLTRLVDAAGVHRAALLVLDRAATRLEVTATHGVDGARDCTDGISLDESLHPAIRATARLDVVACAASEIDGLPFGPTVFLPLPHSRSPESALAGAQQSGEPRDAASWWRGGRAAVGVVALEGRPDDETLATLARAAMLAGPVLARARTLYGLLRSVERLDEQRSLLATLMNALPDPIIITDATNTIVVQNRRAELLLSTREEDAVGRRRAVEINQLLFNAFLSKTMRGQGDQHSARELNLVDPDDGTDLLFEVLSHELSFQVARRGVYVSVLREVTELKRASLELERQFERLRLTEMDATRERDRLNLILNNVGDPILVTDGQSKIILMNPKAEQLFELPEGSSDHVQAQRVRGNDTKFTTLISDFATSPSTFRRERIALVQPQTGVGVPMEVVAGKVMNERGEPLAIVSVLHDLTTQVENERLYQELKKFSGELEVRIRLATADLEAQNLRLQWQSSELEKAYRLKSEFLANMSHELRTPINALIGYTALMLDRIYGELTPKQVEGLTRIQASSQHLLALINDILDLARIEAGKMPVHLEPALLRQVLSEVTAQIEPMVRRKHLQFSVSVSDRIPPMYTDRTKIKQIVLNLLSNAVKFTQRGSVSLSATERGESVEIVVRDSGIGIKPEYLEMIFEEFRQVDQSRTREYGGTGLGLSITRKLIALLGGSITVDSEYGRGTVFTVTLPIRSQALTLDEQVARAMVSGMHPPS